MPPTHYHTISLKKDRVNGLKFLAKSEKRAVASLVDLLLERVGVPELTDEELAERLAELEVQKQESKSLEALIK